MVSIDVHFDQIMEVFGSAGEWRETETEANEAIDDASGAMA
jgi:hypothetical protein